MIRTIIILLLSSLFFSNSFGQKSSEPIVIGQKHIIESVILNESREYWVHLPSDYDNSKYEYPVMYLLDGQEYFYQITGLIHHMTQLRQRMPRTIVVGIVSTELDRVRDYTPNDIEILPGGGGADNFTEFIRKELIPEIDKQYRTNNFRILFGHSLAGVCVNHIFTKKNELFNAYFATDPANFVDTTILKSLKSFITKQDTIPSNYFLSVSGDVMITTITPNFELYNFIKLNYPDKMVWDFKFYPDEDHSSLPLKAVSDGLEKLFHNYNIPTDYLNSYDIEKILGHISANEKKHNLKVAPVEQFINEVAIGFCANNKHEDALRLLQLNIDNYKEPHETYYFIGEVYRLKGDKEKALLYFEKSFAIKEFWDVKEKITQIKDE